MTKKRRILRTIAVALIWLAVWQAAAWLTGNDLLLPSPAATVWSLARLLGTAKLYVSAGMTLLRVLAGFLSGMLAGTLLGVLTAASPFCDALLSPLRSVVKATPVTSFIILVLLWLTSSLTPVFIAFLMVMPIAWTATAEAVRAADRQLLEMAAVFGLGRGRRLRYIWAPSVLPPYLAAATTALGFAWKAGVAAEVISLPALSIGRALYDSKIYIETPDLFAWTAVVIILSMLLERLMVAGLRRIRAW